jgi:phage gp29-like protein
MVAKTDLADETRKRDLAQFLKGMVNNSFLIADLADEIAPMATGGIDGYETYLNMINLLNDSISRTLEGQTMTSDNGSSRSQAEVHERTAEKWHMARLRRLESIINNKLIPKLIADGAPLATTDTFAFVSRENSNTIVDKVLKLSQAGYQVAPDWVTRQTGIPVTPAPQPAAPAGDLQNHAPYFF